MLMTGSEAVAVVVAARRQEVVVTTMTGLGFWPRPGQRDFRVLGLMGAAASIGLGIALARPDLGVWVLDGDGSLMMQLGVLCAVADAAPPALTHIVIDNRVYGVSGAQPVPASAILSWTAAALAAGYRESVECETERDLAAALRSAAPGPRMIVARAASVRPNFPAGAFVFDAAGEAPRLRGGLAAS
jgi:thiamine pyrophosphate-dependent acetolactate synthase large subunit-like protein